MRQLILAIRDRVQAELGIDQWILHLRPGVGLLPRQGILRVFEVREENLETGIRRIVSCGLAVAVEIPTAQAIEAQVQAMEVGVRLSRAVHCVLVTRDAYRIPGERTIALDVLQRPGQELAWYCQAFLSFEFVSMEGR
jgi:hypothetical protein